MEDLKNIFKKQKEFQLKLYPIDSLSTEEKIKYTKEFILSMHRELGEVLVEIPWKLHRKNNKKIHLSHLREELMDCFKFLLNLFLIWEVDEKEFVKLFNEKTKVVEERYKKEIKNEN